MAQEKWARLTWVPNGADTGVDTVLLDSGEELGFLDGHWLLDAALEGIEDGGAQTGTRQPAKGGGAHGHQTKGDERVDGEAIHPVHL